MIPVRSSIGIARATAERTRGFSFARSSSRSLPTASRSPRSSSTENDTRRWAGTRSSSNTSGGTITPDTSVSTRPSTIRNRSAVGCAGRRRHAAAVTSASGCSSLRYAFGSAFTSAVTSSSRMPGTCQSKPSWRTRLSTASGTWTSTPSSIAPGSKR